MVEGGSETPILINYYYFVLREYKLCPKKVKAVFLGILFVLFKGKWFDWKVDN